MQKILVNGIKGFENKAKRMKAEWTRLHRTAAESAGTRNIRKLVGKSTWFKKKTRKETEPGTTQGPRGKTEPRTNPSEEDEIKTRSVLFVDQTPQGELASRLREVLRGLEGAMGFRIKVVERTGATIRSNFPLTKLWEGQKCGRDPCIPCSQGLEELPPCNKTSLVYENICIVCNPSATNKGELKDYDPLVPSIYVGETSRSTRERTREHWKDWVHRIKTLVIVYLYYYSYFIIIVITICVPENISIFAIITYRDLLFPESIVDIVPSSVGLAAAPLEFSSTPLCASFVLEL